MSRIRARVKEHLPAVLLTLLSIVQALALEILWTRMREADFLYRLDWAAAAGWAQLLASFLGIVVVWVIYASSTMRFRWIPTTSDSVYPFVIGIGEFLLVESVRPGFIGIWFLEMAAIFALMNWISHHMLRRARLEEDNAEFFDRVAPATRRDFYPAIATIAALLATGSVFLIFDLPAQTAAAAAVVMNLVMLWQLYQTNVFWERSMLKNDAGGPAA